MSNKFPVVRAIAWISIIPQIAVFAGLALCIRVLARPADAETSLVIAAAIYFVISRVLHGSLLSSQNRGIRLMQQGLYAESIPHFHRSYDFFCRHPLLDQWRYLLLLSSSAIAYREMALCNIAMAHAQFGDGVKSREFYRRALAEFPQSTIAASALRMFTAAETIPKVQETD